jgi:hypothetical protein
VFELGGKIAANKSKPTKADANRIACICFLLFCRIGTFQWVTAKKIKNIPISFRLAAARQAGRGFDPATAQGYSTEF